MSVFVLVHGGWGGGWQWGAVAEHLRGQGHQAYTPTLSGLGDRSHLAVGRIDLSLHVQDVVQHLFFEDLTDVVLVGWSYGGAVVDGVADLVPDRLRHVINLDGEVVHEGRALREGWTDEARAAMSEMLRQAEATGWLAPPSADDLADELTEPRLREWVAERERAHPWATNTEPYPDNGGRRYAVPHTYIRCTDDDWEEEPVVSQLRVDPRWTFRELPVNHLGVLDAPDQVAAALDESVRARGGR